MTGGNRLFWFEWAGGIGGTAIFLMLGILAISRRHIVLGGKLSPPSSTDGPGAILIGAVLIVLAWWCFTLLLRTTRLRRIWQVLALLVGVALAVVAYGGAFDF